VIDLLLYKEALSACGWSTIKTEDLEKLRADLEEAREVIEAIDANLDYLQRLWGKEGVTDNVVDQTRSYLSSHPKEIPPSV